MILNRIVSGSGPDLVLIHGWGATAGVFQALGAALAARFTVHAFDLPGYGASPPCEPYRLQVLTETIARAMPQRCHVAGWSLGALLAMAWARAAPHQIGRVALLAATPCFVQRGDWSHGVAPNVLESFARDLRVDRESATARFVALQVLGDAHARRVASELRRHLAGAARASLEALGAGLQLLLDTDLRTTLAGIAHQTLVVHGERDRLIPSAAGRYLARGIPDARFELIRGAAHAPFLSDLPQVSQLLVEFLHG